MGKKSIRFYEGNHFLTFTIHFVNQYLGRAQYIHVLSLDVRKFRCNPDVFRDVHIIEIAGTFPCL